MRRSLSDIDHSTVANDLRPSASCSARKNPQWIPANRPPVFPGLRPRIWPHPLRLVTKGNVGQAPRNNKPANTLRCGNIKATIWENTSEKGPFFSTTFSRPFKDQSGTWRNGTSFGLNDLEALITVACDAKEWIAAHFLKR